MNDLVIPGLVSAGTLLASKLVDSLLDRRKAARTARRDDEGSALAQVQAVWAELRQLKEDHDEEIRLIREEHRAEIAELRTQIELYKHRTGQAEKRALLAEQERDRLLKELGPLKVEVEQLRQRVKELEKVNNHE